MKLEINNNVAGICTILIICSFLGFICWCGIQTEETNKPQKTTIVKTASTKQSVESLHNYEGSIVIGKKTINEDKPSGQLCEYYVTIYKPIRYFGWGSDYKGSTVTIRVTKWEYSRFECGDEVRF